MGLRASPAHACREVLHIEDRETAQQRYDELRERMTKLVRLEIGDRDPLKIAWRDPEGETILNQVIDQLYEDMGDLE